MQLLSSVEAGTKVSLEDLFLEWGIHKIVPF